MMKPVFISYARDDAEAAQEVCGFLEREGLACWIAPRDVRPGFNYTDEIIEGIEGARAVVLLLSEGANASPHVHREIERAVSLRRPVVPFRLRAVLPSRGLAYLLAGTQWIDAWTPPPEAQLRTLAQAVRIVAGLAVQHREEVETAAHPEEVSTALPPESPRRDGTSPAPQPAKPAGAAKPVTRRWRWVVAVAAGVAVVGVVVWIAVTPAPPRDRSSATVPRSSSDRPTEQPSPLVEVAPGTFLPAGSVFRDPTADGSPCPNCPEMVVVPAGSFTMGSPASETERFLNEGPQHRVTIGYALAVGRYEVTRGEFAAFVSATNRPMSEGCHPWGKEFEWDPSLNWLTPGFDQDDRHPVVCVSWEDVRAYVQWLSQRTGKQYRLLSESEWEYAARAGTTTARWWGPSADEGCAAYANAADLTLKETLPERQGANCRDGYVYTAPVGRFCANGFGLYDMLGNVWKWVGDCYQNSYTGAPNDGGARTSCSNNNVRVQRGGSWIDAPKYVRSAIRGLNDVVNDVVDGKPVRQPVQHGNLGFRVARTL